MTITNVITLLFALALTMTFFGKSIIGIGMGLCVILSLAILVKNRNAVTKHDVLSLIKSKETVSILMMLGVWIISATQGVKPDESIKEVLEYIGIIFGGYIIFSGIQKLSFDFKKLFRFCVIGGTICAAIIALTPGRGIEFDLSNSYGAVLTLFVPMAVYLARINKWWWISVLVLSMGVFAAGGRTAWLTLLSLIVFIPIFMPRRSLKYVVITAFVMIVGVFAGLEIYKHKIGDDFYESRTVSMTNMDRPASGRLTVWSNAIDLIKERPFLGHGIKSAEYLEISAGYNKNVLHVHNAVLEIMLETGVVGFVAFVATILMFVCGFLRSYFRSNNVILKEQAMVIFLSCISYGVCSMALTSMFHAWWFLYLVALLILMKIVELKLRR